MTSDEYEQEIARLHKFTERLAQRLYLAAEVLSILAERKKSKTAGIAPAVCCSDKQYDLEAFMLSLDNGR